MYRGCKVTGQLRQWTIKKSITRDPCLLLLPRYLLEQDFPGMRIGPEPTTDSFIAVMHGDTEGLIPGNALVVDPKKPFRKLNVFGNAFLNR